MGLDRDLLLDMGFILGSGWDHEVYVYEGWFWVHYGGAFDGLPGRQIDGSTATRREFFTMFFEALRAELLDSVHVEFRL